MTRRTHTVRTTRRPDLVIEVDDATLLDLTRRGQLLPLEPEAEPNTTDGSPAVETPEPPPAPRRRSRDAEH